MRRSIIIMILAFTLLLVGCTKESNSDSKKFKTDYESLNGKVNKLGKEHRKVSIDIDNPFEEITAKELLEKLDNKETFYVYFGDKLCPWCRSVIEKAIEVSKENNIKKIYYVAIWDDEGNEIVRDKYEIKEGNLVKNVDGCSEYSKLLDYFDNVLKDYNLTDSEGNSISTGEKRIYAPNFIYVKDGVSKKMTTGISDKQTDSRQELTDEILKDEQKLFEDFFE